MEEKDIQRHLAVTANKREVQSKSDRLQQAIRAAEAQQTRRREQSAGYRSFTASELYCPNCKAAMRVRERLLLVLPTGDLYDYACVKCGTSLGSKTTKG